MNQIDQNNKEVEFKQKQTVFKIKAEIWNDRVQFLQKMLKLEKETHHSHKPHSLMQVDKKTKKTEEDLEDDGDTTTGKVIEADTLKDLLKAKKKAVKKRHSKATEDDTDDLIEKIKQVDDVTSEKSGLRYIDELASEYKGEKKKQIRKKVDRMERHRVKYDKLDIYDMFKEFDVDGDGIVDEIDWQNQKTFDKLYNNEKYAPVWKEILEEEGEDWYK